MSWHTPERKTEQALKTYLQTVLGYEIEGLQICTRFCNVVKTEPRIEIVAETCEPADQDLQYYTGNWNVTVMLRVISHYDEGVDSSAHDEIVGNLVDKLIVGDGSADLLADEINATQFESDFTAQQVDILTRTNRTEDHSLVTEQELMVLMSPSTL